MCTSFRHFILILYTLVALKGTSLDLTSEQGMLPVERLVFFDPDCQSKAGNASNLKASFGFEVPFT